MLFKNSVDVYYAVLTEINKEFNASFETWDYTYFINKSIYEWIKLKYDEYELTQKRTDDLQLITQRNFELPLFNLSTQLPSDYLFLLGVRAEVLGITKCDSNGIIKEVYKITSDRKGYEDSNYYGKLKSWYEISHNTLYIIPQKNTDIQKVFIEYIQKPTYQDLNIDNVDSDKNSLNILFSKEYIAIEIIKLCASLFLETIEQQRFNQHLQLNQQILKN